MKKCFAVMNYNFVIDAKAIRFIIHKIRFLQLLSK